MQFGLVAFFYGRIEFLLLAPMIVEGCKLAAVKLSSAKNNFRRLEAVRREMVLPTLMYSYA